MILALLLACVGHSYELGYDDGCDYAMNDVTDCDDDYDTDDLPNSGYARGWADGYDDCYEAYEELSC